MFFKQIYEPGLAHASYMIGCQKTGECLVIDAKRDVDTYLAIAKTERLTITHLTETHIHADFLAGTRELQVLTKADIYLSNEGGPDWQYDFEHIGLVDGSTFNIGNIKVEVMHTPGHTPEHISFLVTDTPATNSVPVMIFTGDFVFVGDVGRPDLLEKAAGYKGTMDAGARQLWKSMQRFRTLPDHIQVHPAHGAGSACGKALGSVPSSTVGYEKLVNWAFQHTTEDAFVEELLNGQPEPPFYFAEMKTRNKVERKLLPSIPTVPEVSLDVVKGALASGSDVVDMRSKIAFTSGHIPGCLSIPNNKVASTWMGWLLTYDKPFYIIVDANSVEDVVRKGMRIGLDNIAGYMPSVDAWTAAGNKLEEVPLIEHEELMERYNNADVVVVDVRGATDFNNGHIPGAINIHTGYVAQSAQELPSDKTIVLSCASGDRSNIAAGVLLRAGIKNVLNYPLGFSGWYAAKAPVEKTETISVE